MVELVDSLQQSSDFVVAIHGGTLAAHCPRISHGSYGPAQVYAFLHRKRGVFGVGERVPVGADVKIGIRNKRRHEHDGRAFAFAGLKLTMTQVIVA